MANDNGRLVPKIIVDKNGVVKNIMALPEGTVIVPVAKKRKDALTAPIKSAVKSETLGFGTTQGKGDKPGKIDILHGYQIKTTEALLAELNVADRASASLACGMGKTVVAQQLIKDHYNSGASDSGVYIFVTSGIRLTDQSREAFDTNAIIGPHDVFTVHSDSKDYDKARKQFTGVTSEAAETAALSAFLMEPSDNPKIIFATYDSAAKIADVQRGLGGLEADMTIFDESHRLSGEYDFKPTSAKPRTKAKTKTADDDDGAPDVDIDAITLSPNGSVPRLLFNEVDKSVQSNKRVFLTATPSFEEEFEDVYLQTKTRKEKASKTTSPWVYGVTSEILQEIALEENTSKPTKRVIHLDQMNTNVFGRSVASYDINDAISVGALTKVDRTAAVVRSKIPYQPGGKTPDFSKVTLGANGAPSATGMPADVYASISATLQALADGDGEAHNVLAFLPRNKSSEAFKTNWKAVANSMSGDYGYDHDDARKIVDSPERYSTQELKSARITLLSEHADVEFAHSLLKKEEKEATYQFFDEKNQVCTCGAAKGKWCACARIISNFDLFTQGIDIKEVDTVVQMNNNRLYDAAITQSVGRAARVIRDKVTGNNIKTSARVVTPVLTYDTSDDLSPDTIINADIVNKTLLGWSRMGRNVAKAAFAHQQMRPVDEAPIRILGTNRSMSTTEMHRQTSGDPVVSFIQHNAYKWVKSMVDGEIKIENAGKSAADKVAYTTEEKDARYREYADSTTVKNEFLDIIRDSKYPNFDAELAKGAENRWEAVYARRAQYDKASLSEMENFLLYADNKQSENGDDVGPRKTWNPTIPIWSIRYQAETTSKSLRSMGVSEEMIAEYANVGGPQNMGRLRAEGLKLKREQAKYNRG